MMKTVGPNIFRPHTTHSKELASIRVTEFRRFHGELLWEQGQIACIRHASQIRVGTRIKSIVRGVA